MTSVGESFATLTSLSGTVATTARGNLDQCSTLIAELDTLDGGVAGASKNLRAADQEVTHGLHIAEGLENFPDTLVRLFRGENTGKLVLEIAD